MASIFSRLYQKNSVYVAIILGSAFAFQGFFDTAITQWYQNHNKGKLWHDVKGKFVEGGDEEDDE